MIPVFSVVGSGSNTGKTTLICAIIPELKRRGYKVATLKHDVHGFEIDKPGKDSFKHSQAGADITMISSFEKFAMIEKVWQEYSIDEICQKINADILITEGYKKEDKPKLEVHQGDMGNLLCEKDDTVFAIVCNKKIRKDIPQFRFDEIEKLVDFLELKFLKKR